jgi:serine protease AprX
MEGMRLLSRLSSVVLLAVLLLALLLTPRAGHAATLRIDPLLQQQLRAAAASDVLSAIVTYQQYPTKTDLQSLLATGASVAALERLPMVGVRGTPAQLRAITQLPNLRSVYANQRLTYFLRESVPLIGAPTAWESGFKGDGIGVAVLDTGVDGTHKDLEFGKATVQNVKFIGLQYAAGVDLDDLGLPVHYVEDVANTDTTGGHGTHVAGIVGATGAASNGYYRGVAPEADLIGLGVGDTIEIFSALAGFDWIIKNKSKYNIRVVNCSWGNIVPGFDPENPVNVATKAVHNAGIAVVFASGNSGSGTDTLNTYSVAPWVIGVAAGDKDGKNVSFFSSRGIPGDPFYHPTLTAPGYLIVSDRATTGATTNATTTSTDAAFIPPEHLASYTTASGTSMAAPHVAGTIALMVQANPSLTPDVIKRVLINTATPLPGYQEYAAGAGYLNAAAAVAQAQAIKNIRSYRDPRTGKNEQVYDLTTTWNGTVLAGALGVGSADSRELEVVEGTLALDVTIDWNVVANDLTLRVYDPQGRLAASSEVIQSVYNYANETVRVQTPVAGTWRVEVSGFLSGPQDYKATSNAVVLVNP